jgi:hypothetical protein
VLAVTSARRDAARELDVFEFAATMPDDNFDLGPETRLDPNTCELVDSFVAPSPE